MACHSNPGWDIKQSFDVSLTLRPPSMTIVPYANSLDPDETQSNSASHPDPSCLTLRQHFHQLWATLRHFENWSRLEIKQTPIYLAGKGLTCTWLQGWKLLGVFPSWTEAGSAFQMHCQPSEKEGKSGVKGKYCAFHVLVQMNFLRYYFYFLPNQVQTHRDHWKVLDELWSGAKFQLDSTTEEFCHRPPL